MTNTERAIELLKSGRRFHSKDLNELLGWDFRKYMSNAKKELTKEGYDWHTQVADKRFNWYWVTKNEYRQTTLV